MVKLDTLRTYKNVINHIIDCMAKGWKDVNVSFRRNEIDYVGLANLLKVAGLQIEIKHEDCMVTFEIKWE